MSHRKIYKELLQIAKKVQKEHDGVIVMINVIKKEVVIISSVEGG